MVLSLANDSPSISVLRLFYQYRCGENIFHVRAVPLAPDSGIPVQRERQEMERATTHLRSNSTIEKQKCVYSRFRFLRRFSSGPDDLIGRELIRSFFHANRRKRLGDSSHRDAACCCGRLGLVACANPGWRVRQDGIPCLLRCLRLLSTNVR